MRRPALRGGWPPWGWCLALTAGILAACPAAAAASLGRLRAGSSLGRPEDGQPSSPGGQRHGALLAAGRKAAAAARHGGGEAAAAEGAAAGRGGGEEQPSKEEHPPSQGESRMHELGGSVVFAGFGLFLCCMIPVIRNEWTFYRSNIKDSVEDTFWDYLGYRFTSWFTGNANAPSLVLLFLTVGLIVTGALFYALLVGVSPAHALWTIFVWSTGSPAEGEGTPLGRLLGIGVTVCGLIILSLLLSIVTEVFGTWMHQIKQGLRKVVEGGHTVILGFSDCSRCLLEELANARESEGGGRFVILAKQRKEVVEESLLGEYFNLRNSTLIVRSGSSYLIRDLNKVAASTASQVLLLADQSVAQEESDAENVRVVLALKTKGWPIGGRIVVQCCCEANRELFENLYNDKVEVVVVGDIVAKLMARSSQMLGLGGVFSMMLGFEGDEFYSQEWPELYGKSFREIVFRFPSAVVLGVFTASGECRLNPGWDHSYQEGERIIVLAEDNDKYKPAAEPYFKPTRNVSTTRAMESRRRALQAPATRASVPTKLLVVGWNSKIGPLLYSLEDMVATGSTLEIFSPRPRSEREEAIEKLQQTVGRRLRALSIKHIDVEESQMTSRFELEKLRHHTHDSIFMLADVAKFGTKGADVRTLAALAQLQYLNRGLCASERKAFDPVVEMCEDSTAEHLKVCGLTNFVHSNSLVSQALAAVTEEPSVNAIYHDLMSAKYNQFEFRALSELLPEGEELPETISFGEIAYRASLVGDISVVAWSFDQGADRKWELNPKDKRATRQWSQEDRVVVIRHFGQEALLTSRSATAIARSDAVPLQAPLPPPQAQHDPAVPAAASPVADTRAGLYPQEAVAGSVEATHEVAEAQTGEEPAEQAVPQVAAAAAEEEGN